MNSYFHNTHCTNPQDRRREGISFILLFTNTQLNIKSPCKICALISFHVYPWDDLALPFVHLNRVFAYFHTFHSPAGMIFANKPVVALSTIPSATFERFLRINILQLGWFLYLFTFLKMDVPCVICAVKPLWAEMNLKCREWSYYFLINMVM